jgi:hypothetical protein
MFLCPAIYHAVVNWVVSRSANTGQEIGFFLSNHVSCLAETIVEWTLGRTYYQMAIYQCDFLGYAWVMECFCYYIFSLTILVDIPSGKRLDSTMFHVVGEIADYFLTSFWFRLSEF